MLDKSFCISIPDSSFKTNQNVKKKCKDQFDMEHIFKMFYFQMFSEKLSSPPFADTISCPTLSKEGDECEFLAS